MCSRIRLSDSTSNLYQQLLTPRLALHVLIMERLQSLVTLITVGTLRLPRCCPNSARQHHEVESYFSLAFSSSSLSSTSSMRRKDCFISSLLYRPSSSGSTKLKISPKDRISVSLHSAEQNMNGTKVTRGHSFSESSF